jgi:hypothetical protein
MTVAFSPDGKQLASAGDDLTVKLWDASSGKELQALKGHTKVISSVAFSPDGARLASASHDFTVKLWDLATGQELHTLKGHANHVWGVAFSPDGERLASTGGLGLKLWHPSTGQELRTLRPQPALGAWLWPVAFSLDRTRLASASWGQVRLWDARPLTPEVKAEVEAVELLRALFARPLPRSAVRTAVNDQVILTDAARQNALKLINRFPEETDPQMYHAAAWTVVRHPHANVFTVQTALAQMKAACERAPREDRYRSALGVAHYRLGKFLPEHYPQALTLLTRCDSDQPTTLAFLAMTQHKVGLLAEAKATMVRLRTILKDKRWATDQQSRAFLAEAEAEELILDKKPEAGK